MIRVISSLLVSLQTLRRSRALKFFKSLVMQRWKTSRIILCVEKFWKADYSLSVGSGFGPIKPVNWSQSKGDHQGGAGALTLAGRLSQHWGGIILGKLTCSPHPHTYGEPSRKQSGDLYSRAEGKQQGRGTRVEGESPSPKRQSNIRADCPEMLYSLHPWRLSKPKWIMP